MDEFHPKPFGKYYLMKMVGRGKRSEFYLAKTFGVDALEKKLVLKRLLPHFSADKDRISKMIEEAKIGILLNHTNIIQYYDLGKVGDDYFISMEFLNGISLEKILDRCNALNNKVPEDIAIYIITEACRGLNYIHSKKDGSGNPLNLTHNDICPRSVMVSFEGEVKINCSDVTCDVNDYSQEKKDLISLGSVLYEMLYGEKPDPKKLQQDRNLPESISAPLRGILGKLFYFENKGFKTAGDVQFELFKYLIAHHMDFRLEKLKVWMRTFESEKVDNGKICL